MYHIPEWIPLIASGLNLAAAALNLAARPRQCRRDDGGASAGREGCAQD
jgi:hypothetical protein